MDIMFDLETWGTRPCSAIRSIGAVAFELDGPDREWTTFYRNVEDHSCWLAGLRIEPATVDWWKQQKAETQALMNTDKRPLVDVVQDFHRWFVDQSGLCIWCQGAGFDEPIWMTCSKVVGHVPPWKFWNVRDTRTIYHLSGLDPRSITREGPAHGALHDALYQVKCVREARRRLNGDTKR